MVEPSDFDELLGLTQDDLPGEPEAPVAAPAPAAPPEPEVKAPVKRTRRSSAKAAEAPTASVLSPEAARIAELEAQLAQPAPAYSEADNEEPEEDPVITAQKARIKELEDQLARRNAASTENTPAKLVRATDDGERILIHFEEDGFVAFGTTWYRGQEIEVTVGSPVYERTKNRLGQTWIDMVDDRNSQLQKYGKVYFARGPFVPRKGEQFTDDLVAEDARRGRAVPLPQH